MIKNITAVENQLQNLHEADGYQERVNQETGTELQKPKFPLLAAKSSTKEEISAIKFLLDNFVEEVDIRNVFELNDQMTKEIGRNGNFLRKCLLCHGGCKMCKFCQCREKDIFLINNAFQKMRFYNKQSEYFRREMLQEQKRTRKSGKPVVLPKQSLETFQKLKLKLNNIKAFYPGIYNSEADIMSQWGQGNCLTRMNPALLILRDNFPFTF
ncbi:hypothetical protein HUJ04_001754 [Dendroctonus ponderosae]|uniref:Uncharacterized protein n=1 Tax=Dendroctonus ponderosae TaxID=77166 RepID=A0AAR5Q0P4_DENPD|nr:hypothetical protein HUJ04_001753 [Dendroctonus ponderosae]KAH1009395.1 hypothetical protein HUJ04_001754 [Dendroctonus ponderosae]